MNLNDLTPEAYNQYVTAKAKPSPIGKNMTWAFLVGGLLCTVSQLLLDLFRTWGLDQRSASTVLCVTLIGLTALLTGIGVYDLIAKRAGAGVIVPITGFANAMTSPALEFKSEGYVTGTAVKLFTVAGPVLVYGISASVVYGVIVWAVGLL